MSLARERLEFAPPRTPGMIRALILAVLAHAVLIGVLTAGVAWKREAKLVTAEAELWSAIPQEAAAPAPPEVPPAPVEVTPETTPKPVPEPQPAPEPPKPVVASDPAIALAQEKAKRLKEKQARELAQDKIKKEKLDEEKLKKDRLDKLAKDKEKAQALAKANAATQKANEAKALAESKKLEEIRQQNLKRMAGLAGGGGSGASSSASATAQSSAPSASYAGRVRARIKPNITYVETIVGNPTTEIEVRTSPDGTIISSRVVKASGTKSWDNAALNAIEKTGKLPFDENGRVPSLMVIVLSPQELIGN